MSVRVVLDTNVIVNALIGPEGPAESVLEACFRGQLDLQMGVALAKEYEDVSRRPEIIEKAPLSIEAIEALIDSLFSIARPCQVYFGWRPNLDDEGDNHVLELAVASGARYLITSNTRDFAKAELQFPAIEIVTPAQLMAILRGEP